jgi:hypothetical protein
MVKASLELPKFLNCPTAVQFPADAHDTDLKSSWGYSAWTPSGNTAGRASVQTPFVDVMVNASMLNASMGPSLFRKDPTAVQFPGDVQDTDRKFADE